MKKTIFYIMLAVLSLAMVSCSNNNEPTDKNIVGTWFCKYETYTYEAAYGVKETNTERIDLTFKFSEDKTFTMITSDNDVEKGKWELIGKKLILENISEFRTLEIVSISSSQMTLRGEYGNATYEYDFIKQ